MLVALSGRASFVCRSERACEDLQEQLALLERELGFAEITGTDS